MDEFEIEKLKENRLTSLSFSAQPPLTSWLHLVVQKANKEWKIKEINVNKNLIVQLLTR